MPKNNHSIGNAGEFYVLAQLAQRGYIAGKTDDGQTLIDIIATDPETLKAVNIQVKTTKDESPDWLMSKKNEQHFESLWYVLVHLHGENIIPDFYIFHSYEVGPWLKDDHSQWLATPKRNGEPRKDGNLRHFSPNEEQLSNAKNGWDLMFDKPFKEDRS
tara:strand:+ start:357 stop:833 length:477 start_codon:yes stop_codon:yes gene_type:complete